MNIEEKRKIEEMYEKGLVEISSIIEPLIENFKIDRCSIDIQQCQLVIDYLIRDRDFDENYIQQLETELEKEKEKNKKIEIIVNKLMPLAECSYWNYENHTCTHTCRGCDDLNEYNKRTASGIIIDKDRYCRLYEDGHIQEDTKFVSVEDLINRHLKEE